jgi:hypothetical protein
LGGYRWAMQTVLREGGFRFYSYRLGRFEPPHVHIAIRSVVREVVFLSSDY